MNRKDQAGVALVLELIVVALVLSAVTYAGYHAYQAKQKGERPEAGSQTSVQLDPNCSYNDADLCKAFNRWQKVTEYKTTVTQAGKTSVTTAEVAANGNLRILASNEGQEFFALILTADMAYTKDRADNSWWRQKPDAKTADVKRQHDFGFRAGTGYNAKGKEACGQYQCFRYVGSDAAGATWDIWFDDKDYLLRRYHGPNSKGEVINVEYSYPKVTIEVPSPAKDPAPGQIVIPGLGLLGR